MSIDAEVERKRFEKWWLSEGWLSGSLQMRDGSYISDVTVDSWIAWLAAKRDAEQEAKS